MILINENNNKLDIREITPGVNSADTVNDLSIDIDLGTYNIDSLKTEIKNKINTKSNEDGHRFIYDIDYNNSTGKITFILDSAFENSAHLLGVAEIILLFSTGTNKNISAHKFLGFDNIDISFTSENSITSQNSIIGFFTPSSLNTFIPIGIKKIDDSLMVMDISSSTDNISLHSSNFDTNIDTLSIKTLLNKDTNKDLNISTFDGSHINPVIKINNTEQHINITSNLNILSNLNVIGNTTIACTLDVNNAFTASSINSTGAAGVVGNFEVNTNKFTVDSRNGNTTVAGTLDVSNAFTASSINSTGAAGVLGNFEVNTNKFTVDSTYGNTTIAGTLDVSNAFTASSINSTGAAGVLGNFEVNTNKFTVDSTYGNTTVAGTLDVSGATTLLDTLNVTGTTTINNLQILQPNNSYLDLYNGKYYTIKHSQTDKYLAFTLDPQTPTSFVYGGTLSGPDGVTVHRDHWLDYDPSTQQYGTSMSDPLNRSEIVFSFEDEITNNSIWEIDTVLTSINITQTNRSPLGTEPVEKQTNNFILKNKAGFKVLISLKFMTDSTATPSLLETQFAISTRWWNHDRSPTDGYANVKFYFIKYDNINVSLPDLYIDNSLNRAQGGGDPAILFNFIPLDYNLDINGTSYIKGALNVTKIELGNSIREGVGIGTKKEKFYELVKFYIPAGVDRYVSSLTAMRDSYFSLETQDSDGSANTDRKIEKYTDVDNFMGFHGAPSHNIGFKFNDITNKFENILNISTNQAGVINLGKINSIIDIDRFSDYGGWAELTNSGVLNGGNWQHPIDFWYDMIRFKVGAHTDVNNFNRVDNTHFSIALRRHTLAFRWSDHAPDSKYNTIGDSNNANIQNLLVMKHLGLIGIGTHDPLANLDVNGTLNVTGATTLNGTLNVTGTTTLNGTLNSAIKFPADAVTFEKPTQEDPRDVNPRFLHNISNPTHIYIIADYTAPKSGNVGAVMLRNFVTLDTSEFCYYGWQLAQTENNNYNYLKQQAKIHWSDDSNTLAYLKMSIVGTPATPTTPTDHAFIPEANTLNFTGQHRCVPNNIDLFNNVDNYIGYIVCSSGKYKSYNVLTTQLLENKSGILINESLPVIQLSDKKKQKNVFGVISNKEDIREYAVGAFVTKYPTINDEQRLYINSLGEGAIWIVNTNGNLENGDYVQSSSIIGHGEKQDSEFLANYTVAKITCDCEFDLNNEKYECVEFVDDISGNTYRKAFVGCTYHCG